MINSINTNINNNNGIMEVYDDRPISMYDNLNNITVSTTSTTANNNKPKMAKATISLIPNTTQILTTTTETPPTSSKVNEAAHSTPFTDNNFELNENNNIPLIKQQQLKKNGNRNLNEIHPNTSKAAGFVTPYKTSILKPKIITASPPLTPHQQQQHSPLITTAITAPETNKLTSPSLLHSNATTETATTTTETINLDTFNNFNRPLSQHSQSELNDTSHSIAAVKAALNEAKSKFFGLNGYTLSQQQLQDQQHHYDETNFIDGSLNYQLLPPDIQPNIHQVQIQKQQKQVQKSQPKYQNIPENSAIYRKQKIDGASHPPDLPPKPIQYQNSQQNQPSTRSIQTSIPNKIRQMPADSNTYNQISLNDIDVATSRSQTVYMATTVPQNIKGNKIAGRHTPTRSSLRHSRMLVVNNKNYQEVQHPNPMGFEQPNLARWLLILQIIIGILLLSISIWVFFLTPHTPVQDNPYWCGLTLLITGITGLFLIRFHRFKSNKSRERAFKFLRTNSFMLSILTAISCCMSLIFAAIHYCRLTATDTKCKSIHLLEEHGSCVCTFNAPPTVVNATASLLNDILSDEHETNITNNSYNVEYRDLSCQEVTGPWTSVLGLSFILNSLGLIVSILYIALLTCFRRPTKRPKNYVTVHTSTF